MSHTTEYLRKRFIVRAIVWTPITLAAFGWLVWGIVTY